MGLVISCCLVRLEYQISINRMDCVTALESVAPNLHTLAEVI